MLSDLAKKTGESQNEILEKALEAYRRQRFLEESNEAFDALRMGLPFAEQLETKKRLLVNHRTKFRRHIEGIEGDVPTRPQKSRKRDSISPLSKAWKEEQEERAAWDITIADGLEKD